MSAVAPRLAATERSRFAELETVVERGLATFVEVGAALLEIRDCRLYRETYKTFERYCDDRWGFTDRRARQYIEASVVRTMVPVENERQARELAPLLRGEGEEAVLEVWRELKADHGDAVVTAELVRRAVSARLRRDQRRRDEERIRARARCSEQLWHDPVQLGDGLELRHGDFRDLELESESVDLIFCDPPYHREFVPLWSELGAFAARVLKPGRLLVAYSGNCYAREALAGLDEHLHFVTLGSVFLPGAQSLLHRISVFASSKPLLFYSAGRYEPRGSFANGYWVRRPEKARHPWQQEAGCARYYIEELTEPGELVLDPLLGSGTTGLACLELSRRFLGVDVDPEAIATSAARLAEAAGPPRADLGLDHGRGGSAVAADDSGGPARPSRAGATPGPRRPVSGERRRGGE